MELWLLAGWWLLLLVTVGAGIAYARAQPNRQTSLALAPDPLAYPVRVAPTGLQPRQKTAGMVMLFGGLAVVFGLLPILFRQNESEISHLHARFILTLITAALLLAPWIKTASPRRVWVVPICVVIGLLVAPYAGYHLFADLVWPRTIVEGRVEGVRVVGRRHDTEYLITLDGRTYQATHAAMRQAQPGARVALARGAGTGMVFSAEVLETPTMATPMGEAFGSGAWLVQGFALGGGFHHCLMWSDGPVDFIQAPGRFAVLLRTDTRGLSAGTFGAGVASGDVSRHVAGTAPRPGVISIPLPGETTLQKSLAAKGTVDFRLPGNAFRVVLAEGHAAALARLAACADAQGRG